MKNINKYEKKIEKCLEIIFEKNTKKKNMKKLRNMEKSKIMKEYEKIENVDKSDKSELAWLEIPLE